MKRPRERRSVALTFRVSQKEHDDLFLPVVARVAAERNLPVHGQRTQAFLCLLRTERDVRRMHEDEREWREREALLVSSAREQADEIARLRVELEAATVKVEELLAARAGALRYLVELERTMGLVTSRAGALGKELGRAP